MKNKNGESIEPNIGAMEINEYIAKLREACKPDEDSADAVHPNHYKLPGGMQVIDVEVALFGKAAVKEHCLCTAAEYILRHKGKNGVEDIRKAHWWIKMFLELEGVL